MFFFWFFLGDNKFRMYLYRVFVSPHFKHFSTITICISSIFLWVPVSGHMTVT